MVKMMSLDKFVQEEIAKPWKPKKKPKKKSVAKTSEKLQTQLLDDQPSSFKTGLDPVIQEIAKDLADLITGVLPRQSKESNIDALLNNLTQTTQSLNQENQLLKDKLAMLEQENAELKAQLAEVTAVLKELQTNYASLQDSIDTKIAAAIKELSHAIRLAILDHLKQ